MFQKAELVKVEDNIYTVDIYDDQKGKRQFSFHLPVYDERVFHQSIADLYRRFMREGPAKPSNLPELNSNQVAADIDAAEAAETEAAERATHEPETENNNLPGNDILPGSDNDGADIEGAGRDYADGADVSFNGIAGNEIPTKEGGISKPGTGPGIEAGGNPGDDTDL